jgi:hypothetical protein
VQFPPARPFAKRPGRCPGGPAHGESAKRCLAPTGALSRMPTWCGAAPPAQPSSVRFRSSALVRVPCGAALALQAGSEGFDSPRPLSAVVVQLARRRARTAETPVRRRPTARFARILSHPAWRHLGYKEAMKSMKWVIVLIVFLIMAGAAALYYSRSSKARYSPYGVAETSAFE